MHHFTLEEANAALAEVRPLVEERVSTPPRARRGAWAGQESVETRIRGNGGGMPPATLAEAAAAVQHEERRFSRSSSRRSRTAVPR